MKFFPRKIKMLKIDEIHPNPYQSRRNFNAKSIENLANSIKEVGFLNPIVVRATKNGYETICGERRLRAAQTAGLKTIPSIVVSAGDRECAQISLVENLERENLTLFEEAEGFFNLLSYHGVKKDKIAKKLSSDSCKINEKLRYLRLSAPIRYKIEENSVPEPIIKELVKLPTEEKQSEVLEIAIENNLSKDDVATLVKETLREMALPKKGKRERKRTSSMPIYINTVRKTLELLKKSGADAKMEERETETHREFVIKIRK